MGRVLGLRYGPHQGTPVSTTGSPASAWASLSEGHQVLPVEVLSASSPDPTGFRSKTRASEDNPASVSFVERLFGDLSDSVC